MLAPVCGVCVPRVAYAFPMCDIRVSRAQARVECAATAPICIIRVSHA